MSCFGYSNVGYDNYHSYEFFNTHIFKNYQKVLYGRVTARINHLNVIMNCKYKSDGGEYDYLYDEDFDGIFGLLEFLDDLREGLYFVKKCSAKIEISRDEIYLVVQELVSIKEDLELIDKKLRRIIIPDLEL